MEIFERVAEIDEKYREYLINLGLSNRTILEYLKIARQFVKLYNIKDDNDAVIKDLVEYLPGRNVLYRGATRSYLLFLGHRNIYEEFVQRYKHNLKPKPPQKIKIVLSIQKIKILIKELTEPYNIICAVQFDTALRASAVLTLTADNVKTDTDGDTYIQVVEKGGKPRLIYIAPFIAGKLNQFILSRNKAETIDRVFSELGNPRTAYQKYEKMLGETSLGILGERITSHVLRRSRASYLFQKGYDIIQVRNLLGHRDISTTSIYLSESGIGSKEIMKAEAGIWSA